MSNRRKILQGVESIGEPVGFQHGTRRFEPVTLCERQGVQQMVATYGDVTLGETLEKNLRSAGFLIQNGGRGREQQDVAIARLRAHRLFGLR